MKGTYRFRHTFSGDEAYLAFGYPYTYGDLQNFLAPLASPRLTRSSIGSSRNGVDQPLLTFSEGERKKNAILVISREDADEITGSFAAEGMIEYLLSDAELVHTFFQHCDLYLVPMVGVDGVIAGATHSAGYGYGGLRWHEQPAPTEIENVKNLVRRLAEDGVKILVAGKLHGGMTMQPVHPVDCLYSDQALGRMLYAEPTADWNPLEREWSFSIRPQGYFERFMLDEFGLEKNFAVHVQGTSADRLRRCGSDLLKAVFRYLEEIR